METLSNDPLEQIMHIVKVVVERLSVGTRVFHQLLDRYLFSGGLIQHFPDQGRQGSFDRL